MDEQLKELRAVIRERIKQKNAEHRGFSLDEVLQDVLATNPDLVVRGLWALVDEEVDRMNNELSIQRAARDANVSVEHFSLIRDISAQHDIPARFLLRLEGENMLKVLQADATIAQFRLEAAKVEAENSKRDLEILAPIWDDNPDMTMGEALQRLKEATDHTLRDLEKGDAPATGL
jgi:hypothetical protein